MAIDYVDQLRNLSGIGRDGDVQTLRAKSGILWAADGSELVRWADGSDAAPLMLPALSRNKTASEAPLFVGADGKLMRLVPADSLSSKRSHLVSIGGAAQWEELVGMNTQFNRDDIKTGTACGEQFVATWEACDDTGKLTLKKQLLSSLLTACGATNAVNSADAIVACVSGILKGIQPVVGFTLGAVQGTDGTVTWGLVALPTSSAAVGQKLVLRYTGSIQTITIPAGATKMYVKCWGASGQNNITGLGGGGGFTYGEIDVTAGQTYGIVIGNVGIGISRAVGDCNNYPGTNAYGFGGMAGLNACVSGVAAGGGLTALVTGVNELAKAERNRALILAGGGGAGVWNGSVGKPGQGGNAANNSTPDMQGINANRLTLGAGSGGGGYYGGNAATYSLQNNGGSGFCAPIVNAPIITAAAGATIANRGDSDFQDQGGRGLVVINFGS